MHKNILQIMAVLAVPAAVAVYYIWYLLHPRILLKQWAEAYRYEIVCSRRRWVFKGPYTWLYQHCAVYRVRVRNRQGYERSGWVCFGNVVCGIFMNETNVTWDKEVKY